MVPSVFLSINCPPFFEKMYNKKTFIPTKNTGIKVSFPKTMVKAQATHPKLRLSRQHVELSEGSKP
ncbi:hypothetical protein D2962_16125 [Biomaibacter acetigenes]|uniref:Uncharacterized protein n=1 Tax=Biomaibacter acetigenes TaxID=2316383 RepID=A0A3G2R959_9FIRM|nr:hypothetical protein D2962_16125 [Biomaibacter acetigenes]